MFAKTVRTCAWPNGQLLLKPLQLTSLDVSLHMFGRGWAVLCGRQATCCKQARRQRERGGGGEVGGGSKTLTSQRCWQATMTQANYVLYVSEHKSSGVVMHAIADLSSSSRFLMIAMKMVSFPLCMKAPAVTAFRKRTMQLDPAGSFSTAMITSTVGISSNIICTESHMYSPQANLLRHFQSRC